MPNFQQLAACPHHAEFCGHCACGWLDPQLAWQRAELIPDHPLAPRPAWQMLDIERWYRALDAQAQDCYRFHLEHWEPRMRHVRGRASQNAIGATLHYLRMRSAPEAELLGPIGRAVYWGRRAGLYGA